MFYGATFIGTQCTNANYNNCSNNNTNNTAFGAVITSVIVGAVADDLCNYCTLM